MRAGAPAGTVRGYLPGAPLSSIEPTSSANASPGALRLLPVVSWASRFRRGDVVLDGTACGPVALDHRALTLDGPARVTLSFIAGPVVAELVVEGALDVDGATARRVRLEPDAIEVDGQRTAADLRLDRILERLVDRLADVRVQARAFPDGELVVSFLGGVEVTIPPDQLLTIHGAATGPAHALRLCDPLVVQVQGATIRLDHDPLRWLGALARVSVHRATLHPDGSVHLEGGARTGLDRVVRGGLQHASARLSRLVRSSPRFARVRAFLTPGG